MYIKTLMSFCGLSRQPYSFSARLRVSRTDKDLPQLFIETRMDMYNLTWQWAVINKQATTLLEHDFDGQDHVKSCDGQEFK